MLELPTEKKLVVWDMDGALFLDGGVRNMLERNFGRDSFPISEDTAKKESLKRLIMRLGAAGHPQAPQMLTH